MTSGFFLVATQQFEVTFVTFVICSAGQCKWPQAEDGYLNCTETPELSARELHKMMRAMDDAVN